MTEQEIIAQQLNALYAELQSIRAGIHELTERDKRIAAQITILRGIMDQMAPPTQVEV